VEPADKQAKMMVLIRSTQFESKQILQKKSFDCACAGDPVRFRVFPELRYLVSERSEGEVRKKEKRRKIGKGGKKDKVKKESERQKKKEEACYLPLIIADPTFQSVFDFILEASAGV